MKIVPHLFDSSKTDQVSFMRTGDAYTELRLNGMNVGYSVRVQGEQQFRSYVNVDAKHETGFSRTAVRSYWRGEGEGCVREQEALLGNITSNSISRISTRGNEQPLQLRMDVSSLTCLRTSRDGRYIAIGNGDGQFEIWNMDMEPYRVYEFQFAEPMSISDMCFSRSNLEVLVSTSRGTMYRFDLHADDVTTLSSDFGWPCYSIDVQEAGDGVAFAGEDSALWLLGVKGATLDESITLQDLPFRMERVHTITGGSYWRVAAMPHARVGCIRTTVGSYATQVNFLRDDLICVLGDQATEVWSLAGEEPQMVARRRHDRDCRILGFGGTPQMVRVALGRAF